MILIKFYLDTFKEISCPLSGQTRGGVSGQVIGGSSEADVFMNEVFLFTAQLFKASLIISLLCGDRN